MAKLVLNNLANLNNQTSAVNTINNNSDLIETAIENTLSRDGTSPNSMGAALDMNSHRIVNLPATPINNSEAASKAYVDTLAGVFDPDNGSVVVSTDNAVPRFDGTGGAVQNSGVILSDANAVSGLDDITQVRVGGLWTDEPNFRPTPITGVNIARFERVFVGAACDNTGVKIAGANPTDWLEDLASFTTANAELAVVSQSGRHAIVCGVRTSDNNTTPSNGIALSVYLDNDNATFDQNGYGMYIEAWRRAGQAFTTCFEVDINNDGSVVDMNPYSASFADTTSAFWCASGGEETPSPNDASVGIAFVNNNAAFRKGIVFEDVSITGTDGVTGTGTAIAFALGHQISWFSDVSTTGMSIWSSGVGVLNFGGAGLSTQTFDVEFGGGRTGNGSCIIDIHTATGTDFEARILRGSGANGNLTISNTGTGVTQIDAANASGIIQLLANSVEKLRLDASGPVALIGTAIPAGGTAGAGYRFSSTANFGIFFGSGAPTLVAAVGSLYLRSDGGASTRLYSANSAAGGAGAWSAITSA